MKFEVVRLGLTVCMHVQRAHLLGRSAGMPPPPGKFRISGLLKSFLMRFLSNITETCCESAKVQCLLTITWIVMRSLA